MPVLQHSRIKLGLAIPTYGLLGGAESHVRQLADELASNQYVDVSILTVEFGSISNQGLEKATIVELPVRGRLVDWLDHTLGFHNGTSGYVTHKHPSRLNSLAFSLRLFLAYTQALRALRLDVIDIHSSPIVLSLVARLLRIPYVVTIHTTAVKKRFRGPLRFLFRYLFAHATICVAVGHRVAENLEACGVPSSKIRVVPTAIAQTNPSDPREISCLRHEMGLLDTDILLYFGGRFVKSKGIDIIIRSLGQLRSSDMRVNLICAGTGPELSNLENMAAQLGVSDNIEFVGALRFEDLTRCMRACDIGIFPSRGEEGLPRALLEFMALGKPVIVSNQGDMARVARDCGFVLDTPNPSQLTAAIRALSEPCAMAQLGHSARNRIESEFSPERIMQTLMQVYHQAAKGEK